MGEQIKTDRVCEEITMATEFPVDFTVRLLGYELIQFLVVYRLVFQPLSTWCPPDANSHHRWLGLMGICSLEHLESAKLANAIVIVYFVSCSVISVLWCSRLLLSPRFSFW